MSRSNGSPRNGLTPERKSAVRGSTESLADLQPAAPEVVLPVEKVASPPEPSKAKVAPKEAAKEGRVAAAPAPAPQPPKPTPRMNGSAEPKVAVEAPQAPKAEAAPHKTASNGVEPSDDNPGYRFLKVSP